MRWLCSATESTATRLPVERAGERVVMRTDDSGAPEDDSARVGWHPSCFRVRSMAIAARVDTEHACHFYDDDKELAARVASFLAPAFPADQAVIAIGTAHHLESIEREIRGAGHDLDGARLGGRYLALDAHETLKALMTRPVPTRDAFERVVGQHVARLAGTHGGVRAFGELVNLLWRDGKRQAALRLEELWNEALGYHPLALICGYSARPFRDSAEAAGLAGLITTHTSTTGPTRRFRS
jgi:DcmR-like sensory protein